MCRKWVQHLFKDKTVTVRQSERTASVEQESCSNNRKCSNKNLVAVNYLNENTTEHEPSNIEIPSHVRDVRMKNINNIVIAYLNVNSYSNIYRIL